MKVVFWLSVLLIFQTFIGYPISLLIISKVFKKKKIQINEEIYPNISLIVAAHNEEKSIEMKILNILKLDYPKEKLEIIVASDNSSDRTNEIIEALIKKYDNFNLSLFKVNERKGKTNAQNEATRLAKGEIIVFSDANSIWKEDSLMKIIRNFNDKNIAYVCGKLEYTNSLENPTSSAENSYWNYDLWMRKIESDYSSITAGNGAIYAIRKENYIEINPIECHDGSFPPLMVLKDKRAIYEDKAVAYEKTGETSSDEFSRKVRMGRYILKLKYSNLSKYNPLKTGVFSYFYFCHRFLRYSLYLLHIILFISNLLLINNNTFYMTTFTLQSIFYVLALLGYSMKLKSKIFYIPFYYCMTIFAQLIAVKKTLLGQNKPFWEKAETTR